MKQKVVVSHTLMYNDTISGYQVAGLTYYVVKEGRKRFTVVENGGNFPILLPNRTGAVEVSIQGNRLVIDDGYRRKVKQP